MIDLKAIVKFTYSQLHSNKGDSKLNQISINDRFLAAKEKSNSKKRLRYKQDIE